MARSAQHENDYNSLYSDFADYDRLLCNEFLILRSLNMTEKIIFNWSGGKDSALALHKVLQDPHYEVICLLTSISEPYQRISMHGVRVDLLEVQAKSIGIPLIKMQIPEMPSMEVYENGMRTILMDLKNQGATTCVFGDIFLEDLRQYRESKLNELDLKRILILAEKMESFIPLFLMALSLKNRFRL